MTSTTAELEREIGVRNPWACPDGRTVASHAINRETWLELRKGMICASDIAKLVGVSKWGDQLSVWADKTGRAPDESQTIPQARGLIFEDAIIELWSTQYADYPIMLRRQGLMAHRTNPTAGATVDRLSACPLGRCIVEVKSQIDTGEWGTEYEPEIPVDYQFQDLWQLYVTGRDHVHNVVLGPRFQPFERIMYRDEELIRKLAAEQMEWWQTCIVEGNTPDATHRGLDIARKLSLPAPGVKHIIDADLAEHVHTAQAARAAITEAEQIRDAAVANIMVAMGGATDLVWEDGTLAATWAPGKTIDGADGAWRKAHPELTAAFSSPGPDVLDVKKLVENHPELIESGQLRHRRPLTWKK